MGKNARIRKQKITEQQKEIKALIKQKAEHSNPFYKIWAKWQFWVYVLAVALIIFNPFYNLMMKEYKMNSDNFAIFHTSMGDISVELYKQDAPNTVANFVKLSKQGFYNGLTFHRVIKGFMIQGGDPKGDGTGGPGYQFADEINSHKIVKGSLAMANAGANTNGSQFYIVTEEDQPSLDGKYTNFGQVVSGLDIAVKISEVATDSNDKPVDAVIINSIEIQSKKLEPGPVDTTSSTSQDSSSLPISTQPSGSGE